MAPHSRSLWLGLALLALSAGPARAQDEGACYGPGSIALAVILSVVLTAALLAGLFYLWRKYRKPKGESCRLFCV
ncbi:hypothetical protein Zmor_007754 [Zophobas morio]|uniref:Uncharacterized protein n=1 Tax=Zophobas morio TaxID=2755281 RepID=A0AA38IU44_9CUCU|nr:hypothetical protein Zmor_007754 [Zophobas morio]